MLLNKHRSRPRSRALFSVVLLPDVLSVQSFYPNLLLHKHYRAFISHTGWSATVCDQRLFTAAAWRGFEPAVGSVSAWRAFMIHAALINIC